MAMIPPDVEFAVEDEAGPAERATSSRSRAKARLAAAFESPDPLARAWAYQTWAGHYGWRNFDPLVLDREEIEARYDLEL
jgi:hypothetical protein